MIGRLSHYKTAERDADQIRQCKIAKGKAL